MRKSCLALLLVTGAAWGTPRDDESVTAGAVSSAEPPDDDEEPELIVPALPGVEGHLTLALNGGLSSPWGGVDAATSLSDLSAGGTFVGGELGWGVSHNVAAALWGHHLFETSGDEATVGCPGSCAYSSSALGIGVRYHLVQGQRFDPYLSAGLGYRFGTATVRGQARSVSGVEWLHLVVGGDWYALSHVAVGPFFELDAGTFSSSADTANHWQVLTGARLVLDAAGR